MHPITINILLECAEKRMMASNCSRCGGTGKFKTVSSSADTSRYGQHCFACGDAYKLPRKWTLMNEKEIASLFHDLKVSEAKSIITRLINTKILTQSKADEVMSVLNIEV